MPVIDGIVRLCLLSAIAFGGATQFEPRVSAQAARQSPAEHVIVLTVEGMT